MHSAILGQIMAVYLYKHLLLLSVDVCALGPIYSVNHHVDTYDNKKLYANTTGSQAGGTIDPLCKKE